MIQRPQSIFLLLAAIALGTLFLPSLSFTEIDYASESKPEALANTFHADGMFNIMDHITLLSLSALGGLISLIAIFTYSNRGRQKLLSRMAIVLTILLASAAAFYFYVDYPVIDQISGLKLTPSFGLVNPVLALIFLILAIRFINKDERLVRSMDRLR
jgi:glucan phosphoethanolaminetransferase (alkaline phosphatase superfamily)